VATVLLNDVSLLPESPDGGLNPLAPGLDPTWSLAELQTHLGDITLNRIRLFPSPGRATEQDLLTSNDRKSSLTELIDGTLVEKALGHFEARLAFVIAHLIEIYNTTRNLGVVYADGCVTRLSPEQIRIPDVCFFRWTTFPNEKLPTEQILDIAPDLAVEVISPTNTSAEMERKLTEYFQAGTRLVWYFYPKTESVRVFRSPKEYRDLNQEMVLEGGDVLPGFEITVKALFDQASGCR